MLIFTKNLELLFENNQIITASRIMILTHEMIMNEKFNMIGLTYIFFLTSLRTSVCVVKQYSLDITQFFTGHFPMSGANIQTCIHFLICLFIKNLSKVAV